MVTPVLERVAAATSIITTLLMGQPEPVELEPLNPLWNGAETPGYVQSLAEGAAFWGLQVVEKGRSLFHRLIPFIYGLGSGIMRGYLKLKLRTNKTFSEVTNGARKPSSTSEEVMAAMAKGVFKTTDKPSPIQAENLVFNDPEASKRGFLIGKIAAIVLPQIMGAGVRFVGDALDDSIGSLGGRAKNVATYLESSVALVDETARQHGDAAGEALIEGLGKLF